MSIEILDESGAGAAAQPHAVSDPGSDPRSAAVEAEVHQVDQVELAGLARFVLGRMRVHPQAELCIKLVDEATIAEVNARWMGGEGPTDVLAFPMDELRPGAVNDEPEEGILGDLMLCWSVARRQAAEARQRGQAGYTTADEVELLTVHGILHLLGYDHAETEEHREMFALQARLLAEWQGVRTGQPVLGEEVAR